MTPARTMAARRCQACGKLDIKRSGGCMSFRYQENGNWQRGYFHIQCFRAKMEKGK